MNFTDLAKTGWKITGSHSMRTYCRRLYRLCTSSEICAINPICRLFAILSRSDNGESDFERACSEIGVA